MGDPRYQDLETLIKEYEADTKTIRSDKLIIRNYPKVFTMSVASSFEYYVKQDLDAFLTNPLHSIASSFPNIQHMIGSSNTTPVSERMYKKFYTKPTLTADPFYQLFTGAQFKGLVQNNFNAERTQQLQAITTQVSALEGLLGASDAIDDDYIIKAEKKERLEQLTFDVAEQAFLNLKLRRNHVAHDYLHGLSDTFVDIRNFYYDAVIYVIALSKTIADLTQPTT